MSVITDCYQHFKPESSNTSSNYIEDQQNVNPASSVSVLTARASFLSQELDQMYDECSSDNWDGYGASALSSLALNETKQFISQMPIWMSEPELVPEPSGDVGLQWDFGKNKMLTISFSGDNSLVYAAILGSPKRKKYGSEIFNRTIPEEINQYMGQLKN